MDYHIQQLPEEYANKIRTKFQEYKKSAETDDKVRDAIVGLIFDCASKNYDNLCNLQQICQIQIGNEHIEGSKEGKFRAAIRKRIVDISSRIVKSDHGIDLKIGGGDWCLMNFIGQFCIEDEYLYNSPRTSAQLKQFLLPIACTCIENNDSSICRKRNCQVIPVSPKQINDLQKYSEYRIQCGIVFLESIERLMIYFRMNEEFLYWHGRLIKYWPYFGKHTQEMIRDYVQPKRNELEFKSDKDFKENEEQMRIQIEQQIKSEKETNEIISNLMAENDQLRSQLKQEAIQIMDFKFKIEELEKLIETRNQNHKNVIKCPNICRIHQKYEKILKTDLNNLYPSILSNIDKLLQMHPKSIEILTMKLEILKFEGNIEEYLRKINENYWKIERNPDISIEELGAEIEQVPSDDFMAKYQKLVAENNLS